MLGVPGTGYGTGSRPRPDAAAEEARTQTPMAKELSILYPEPLVFLHHRAKGLCLPSPWERKEPRMWRCDSVGVGVRGVVSLKTRGFPVTVEFGLDAPHRRRLAAKVRHRATR
jgi:hypothetical protein